MKELLDVYDKNGNKTGEVIERYCHEKNGAFYLCTHAYIITPENKFIIQKRSLKKKYFPGIWDVTCGAVSSGENSLEAARREVFEELGLDVTGCEYTLVGRSIYKDCFSDVYFFFSPYSANDCVIDTAEVGEVKEVTKEELLDLIVHSNFKNEDYYTMINDAIKKNLPL